VAQVALGEIVSRLGFMQLARSWLFSGLMAYPAIRRRDIYCHRRSMIRNHALTFAAFMLRTNLGLFFAGGVKFENFYPVVTRLCWMPNRLLKRVAKMAIC
jgi:hypothetical protein